ncbi:Ribonuclease 3 protein [Rutstroemia sp. NJR-2017a WRK4]|nr:Ribonuclease 3 protein [Rutstroemia sp. NJR-2017a WRK4]
MPRIITLKRISIKALDLANEAVNYIVNPKKIADRAKALGIDSCIMYNSRQKGERSPTTLRLVFNAIVGAAWLDSGQDFAICRKVVECL